MYGGNIKGSIKHYYRPKTNLRPYMIDVYDKIKELYGTSSESVINNAYDELCDDSKKFMPLNIFKEYAHDRSANKALEFDIDWWAIKALSAYDFKNLEEVPRQLVEKYTTVFVWQIKGCNLGCGFCYVDGYNNNGKQDHGARFFTMDEIINEFINQRNSRKDSEPRLQLNHLRSSGGEPTLALEQWSEALGLLEEHGLSRQVHLWGDCNGTTGYAWERWIRKGELDKDILSTIGGYENLGVLFCFKGCDPDNVSTNVRRTDGEEILNKQKYTFRKLVDNNIKVYPHMINPNPRTLPLFMEEMISEYGRNIVPLMHILKIGVWTPVRKRNENEISELEKGWEKYYHGSEQVLEDMNQELFKKHYKEIPRPNNLF